MYCYFVLVLKMPVLVLVLVSALPVLVLVLKMPVLVSVLVLKMLVLAFLVSALPVLTTRLQFSLNFFLDPVHVSKPITLKRVAALDLTSES